MCRTLFSSVQSSPAPRRDGAHPSVRDRSIRIGVPGEGRHGLQPRELEGCRLPLAVNERTSKTSKTTQLYFFSRNIRPEKATAKQPADRRVEETAAGMLVVKRAA